MIGSRPYFCGKLAISEGKEVPEAIPTVPRVLDMLGTAIPPTMATPLAKPSANVLRRD
jgi:hypothetical protein